MVPCLAATFLIVAFQTLGSTDAKTHEEKTVYGTVGSKLVLSPGSVKEKVHSVSWRHKGDLAAECDDYEMKAYRQFNDCLLNCSTGELTIERLNRTESGLYRSDINNKPADATQLHVIDPVSEPNVSMRWGPEGVYCVLTCDGGTAESEPINRTWNSKGGLLGSGKELNITKEETVPGLTCTLENPVSKVTSKVVEHPCALVFFAGSVRRERHGLAAAIVLWLVVLFGCIIYGKCRNHQAVGLVEVHAEKVSPQHMDTQL